MVFGTQGNFRLSTKQSHKTCCLATGKDHVHFCVLHVSTFCPVFVPDVDDVVFKMFSCWIQSGTVAGIVARCNVPSVCSLHLSYRYGFRGLWSGSGVLNYTSTCSWVQTFPTFFDCLKTGINEIIKPKTFQNIKWIRKQTVQKQKTHHFHRPKNWTQIPKSTILKHMDIRI